MKIIKIIFLLGAFWMTACFAGTIQVIGSSQMYVPPDYVSFTVDIQSQCYASVNEARKAADQMTQNLYQQLKDIFPNQDPLNQITTHGGYTRPFHPTYSRRKDTHPCMNTFQKTVQITVTTTKLDDFESLFNLVQDIVYSQAQPIRDVQQASTFTTISQPRPALSFEKSKHLEKQVIKKALDNAFEKANFLVKNQHISALQMIAVNETLSHPIPTPMMHLEEKMSVRSAGAQASAPIRFSDSTIRKQLSVVFEYQAN